MWKPRRKRKLTIEQLEEIVESQRSDLNRLQGRFYDLLDYLKLEFRSEYRPRKDEEVG